MPADPGGAGGTRGVVSAGHPLAAATALDVLRRGGNAVDALIAGSAVQCVVEMPWCGVGGDAFVAVRTGPGEVAVLNGSGAAPAAVESRLGPGEPVPRFGPLSVAVPGTVGAWDRLAGRFGSWPLDKVLADAVHLATNGFPLDRRLAGAIAGLAGGPHADLHAALTAGTGARPGELFRQPDLAAVLAGVGAEGADHLYRGPVARRIAEHVRSRGGVLDEDDLAAHDAGWSEPATVAYRDAAVHTQRPVSMGAVLLAELAVLRAFDLSGHEPGGPDEVDLLVRCKQAAFADVLPRLGDPDQVDGVAGALAEALDDDRCAAAAERIRAQLRAGGVPGGRWAGPDDTPPDVLVPTGTDTTSLAVTDGDGTVAVLVHSLFNEFGARELVPGTGIVLNDRLANLRVDPAHPNGLRGGRRPVHTLHTYVAERPDGTVVAGATPGGRGQVQTNLQVLVHVLDHGDDVQAAIDRPRWVSGTPRRSPPDDILYLEAETPPATVAELAGRGHAVEVRPATLDDHFGCATVVAVDAGGRHSAGADRRRAAAALGW